MKRKDILVEALTVFDGNIAADVIGYIDCPYYDKDSCGNVAEYGTSDFRTRCRECKAQWLMAEVDNA